MGMNSETSEFIRLTKQGDAGQSVDRHLPVFVEKVRLSGGSLSLPHVAQEDCKVRPFPKEKVGIELRNSSACGRCPVPPGDCFA